MKEFEYTIKVENGIHARPAGKLVSTLKKFESNVMITTDCGKNADGKKLFAIMSLGVKEGDNIKISFDGSDEDSVLETTQKFMVENF